MPSRQPFALAAFAASIAAHVAIAALLVWNVGEGEEDEPDVVVDVDLDIAPPAPAGFDPSDPSSTLVDEPSPEPVPEKPEAEESPAETTLETDEDEAAKEREARARREEEERRKREEEELAKQGPPDAGPSDTAVAGSGDAGPDGTTVATARDGGAAPSFAETAAQLARESSNIAGPATTPAKPEPKPIALPPGATADLRVYAPQGDKIAVLLRYDRLRGTPWAALADAIIAPMPDYRSIVGNRKVALAELFHSLLITTRNPTNVTATTLVARTQLGAGEVRRFLDHPLQPVSWQAARGGALGRREPSELRLDRDHRVYLMPFPGMVVLTGPKHLGVLAERAPAGRDLDGVRAAEPDVPAWLARARTVENEAGVDADVIAVVTVGGLRRAEVELPEFGSLPTPERFSMALEMAKVGFYVRGTLAFATPELAADFETRLGQGRQRLLGSRFGQLMLRNLHGFHALKGLTLRRRGALVTYATSISNSDAKAAMKLAAEWARRFFEIPPEEGAPATAPREGAGAPPAPARPQGPARAPGAREAPAAPAQSGGRAPARAGSI